MYRVKSDEPAFETLFRQAVIDSFVEEIKAIPSDEELKKIYSFSPQFERRMEKLLSCGMPEEAQ